MAGSSSSYKHKLDPAAVLRRASSVPGCKSIPVPNSPLICSFLVGLLEPQNRDPDKLARISVFTDTGTVSIGRVQNGTLRQVFRQKVNSLDTIEDLLRDPPRLTKVDETLLLSTAASAAPRTPLAQLELVEVGCAILNGEREKLNTHVATLEQMQREMVKAQQQQDKLNSSMNSNSSSSKAAAAAAAAAAAVGGPKTPTRAAAAASRDMADPATHAGRNSDVSSTAAAAAAAVGSPGDGSTTNNSVGLTGMEFQFSLPPDAMKDVDRCLTDIHSMGKLVRKVATNGRGTVFLYGNGGVAYTPQIPKALYHRLSQLRHSSYEHRPAYVSLGSRDRYYCSFHDGSYAFKGPKGLDRELKKAKKQPVSVAFGSTYDTFCVVFSDGSWKCGGRAVPGDFEEKLGKRRDVHTANLGPEGEWFLKLKQTKKMWWGGIHNELEEAIDDLLDSGHQLHFLDFGEEGSYFVSYD